MRQNNIEDIYTLSPAQEGILFHSLYDSESGLYVSQISCVLKNLNVEALESAWRKVMNRHSILRTAFIWEKLRKPHQIVRREARLPWDKRDWRNLPTLEQGRRLESFLEEDRRRGFTLSQAPLMRMGLFRLTEDSHQLVWTHHHLLLDGWSIFLVLKEVCRNYESLCLGRAPACETSYQFRGYIDWLNRQDMSKAEEYWRDLFKGGASPTSRRLDLVPEGLAGKSGGYTSQLLQLSKETVDDLSQFARRRRVTINTLVQGAWTILLSRLFSDPDPVFGVTVSGRPGDLPGIESIVGLFINILPLRVKVTPEAPLLSWLTGLQNLQVEMRQYEYSPLSQIQKWAEVKPGAPIFSSIVSFENYPTPVQTEVFPLENSMREQNKSIEIENFRWISKSNYPLTLIVGPRAGLSLQLVYDARYFSADVVARLLHDFESLLRRFVERPEATLEEIVEFLNVSEKERQVKDQRRREESIQARLKNVKLTPVSLPKGELVKTGFLDHEKQAPYLIEPAAEGVDLSGWAGGHLDLIEGKLLEYGAVLFRGFNLKSIPEFERVARAICPELFGEYGDLPRENVNGKVYTSTPYPPDQSILFHNESSHLRRWPMKIAFYCMKAASWGGETPIADCRKVYQSLDPAIRERFRQKKVMYVRNYIAGLDTDWQSFFGTADRCQVEKHCRQHDIAFEWIENNALKTWQVCDAVATHPKTREAIFFNQIQLHHTSSIEPALLESLLSLYKQEGLPRQAHYGDGSPIENDVMEAVGEVYRNAKVSFPWREGDVLLLDNMLTAHSRNPYVGERKIVVAMGEMVSDGQVQRFGRG
jgi:alpha-ketoglutarate-dependent taurine dioxygenase